MGRAHSMSGTPEDNGSHDPHSEANHDGTPGHTEYGGSPAGTGTPSTERIADDLVQLCRVEVVFPKAPSLDELRRNLKADAAKALSFVSAAAALGFLVEPDMIWPPTTDKLKELVDALLVDGNAAYPGIVAAHMQQTFAALCRRKHGLEIEYDPDASTALGSPLKAGFRVLARQGQVERAAAERQERRLSGAPASLHRRQSQLGLDTEDGRRKAAAIAGATPAGPPPTVFIIQGGQPTQTAPKEDGAKGRSGVGSILDFIGKYQSMRTGVIGLIGDIAAVARAATLAANLLFGLGGTPQPVVIVDPPVATSILEAKSSGSYQPPPGIEVRAPSAGGSTATDRV
jgi:hypothetical protein